MLILAGKLSDLDFSRLAQIYRGSGPEPERERWAAEQDFYDYLTQVFFRTRHALYAVWEENGTYVSALRLEPYRDGLLMEALETAPDRRRTGCASRLMEAVLLALEAGETKRLYSHVSRNNPASLAFHRKWGFRKISDTAAYVDGSVVSTAVTLCRTLE